MPAHIPERSNKQTGGPCRCWHADGTPFDAEDYRKAGLTVPTLYQLTLWAEADAERARRRRQSADSQ